jgi:hypothetical protein
MKCVQPRGMDNRRAAPRVPGQRDSSQGRQGRNSRHENPRLANFTACTFSHGGEGYRRNSTLTCDQVTRILAFRKDHDGLSGTHGSRPHRRRR